MTRTNWPDVPANINFDGKSEILDKPLKLKEYAILGRGSFFLIPKKNLFLSVLSLDISSWL
jgi:hypothetical protein